MTTPVPSTPLIDSSDLAVYLYDDTIDETRANFLIRQAQDLCESIVDPLPAKAAVVVTRVAGRAYVTTASTRGAHMSMAGSQYGLPPGADGGVFLTRQDVRDLRRITGSGNAFTINPLPSDYSIGMPPWDLNTGFTDPSRQ